MAHPRIQIVLVSILFQILKLENIQKNVSTNNKNEQNVPKNYSLGEETFNT